MLEKFVQATIITFLLHLIVELNTTTAISSKTTPPSETAGTSVASSLLGFFE